MPDVPHWDSPFPHFSPDDEAKYQLACRPTWGGSMKFSHATHLTRRRGRARHYAGGRRNRQRHPSPDDGPGQGDRQPTLGQGARTVRETEVVLI